MIYSTAVRVQISFVIAQFTGVTAMIVRVINYFS